MSPKEVSRHWELWIPPSKDEIDSLFVEKEALEPVKKEKWQALIEEAKKKGVRIEIIPSKLVLSKKPGKKGGKQKVRWVACG